MNSQIHTLVVAHHIESRVQDAVSERPARVLRRRRREARHSVPEQSRRVRVTARA